MGRTARLGAALGGALALALLLAATGCLGVPDAPGGGGGDGGAGVADAGGGSAGDGGGDGCTTLVDQDFRTDPPAPEVWQLFTSPERATAQHQQDGVLLRSVGLSSGDSAYAELSTVEAHAIADTELLVDVDAAQATGQSAQLEIAWTSGVVEAAIEVSDGTIGAFLDTGAVVTPLCDGGGCPTFVAGTWTFALRHRDGLLELGAAADGAPVAYFASSSAVLTGTFYSRNATFAEVDDEVAEAIVTRVSWRSCPPGS